MVTKEDRELLLRLAENAIIAYPKITYPDSAGISDSLKEKKGSFVSLYVNGKLRGCIGNIFPAKPLYRAVIDNAASAAYSDNRFPPITGEEAGRLRVEISILTEPVKLEHKGAYQLLEKLTGEEGIIIRKGHKMATFLPQVWSQIPDRETFLAQLCLKAQLNEASWKDEDTEVFAYTVEKFSN